MPNLKNKIRNQPARRSHSGGKSVIDSEVAHSAASSWPSGQTRGEIRNISGFSLIELVFAMFFLMIIVFGVASLQSSNLAMATSQNKEIQAHFYANQGIVIVEVLGVSKIQSQCAAAPCDLYLFDDSGEYKFSAAEEWLEESFYKRTIRIEDLTTPPSGAYKVSAIIDWIDSTGDHSVKAKRIIYQ